MSISVIQRTLITSTWPYIYLRYTEHNFHSYLRYTENFNDEHDFHGYLRYTENFNNEHDFHSYLRYTENFNVKQMIR